MKNSLGFFAAMFLLAGLRRTEPGSLDTGKNSWMRM